MALFADDGTYQGREHPGWARKLDLTRALSELKQTPAGLEVVGDPAQGQIPKWNAVSEQWEPGDDLTTGGGMADGVVDGASLAVSADGSAIELTLMRTEGLNPVTASMDVDGISYDELADRPTIPAAQVNSDWDASSGVEQILNKPTLFEVVGTPGDGQTIKWNDADSRWEPGDDEVGSPGSGEENVQSDWDVTDTASDAFIKNKPELPAAPASWAQETGATGEAPIARGGTGASTAEAAYDALAADRRVLAWVSFDGTAASVTAADGYNVASITDHGTGDYTVTFSSALPNANYAVVVTADGSDAAHAVANTVTRATGSVRVHTRRVSDGARRDRAGVSVVCIGG